jgi:lipoprotein-anchoring transpeptidase ErfK/SrfK
MSKRSIVATLATLLMLAGMPMGEALAARTSAGADGAVAGKARASRLGQSSSAAGTRSSPSARKTGANGGSRSTASARRGTKGLDGGRRGLGYRPSESKATKAAYEAMGIRYMRHAKDTASGRMSTANDTSKQTVKDFGRRAASKYGAGTIVISNYTRRLYYVTGGGRVISYPIATPRPSEIWTGVTKVTRKEENPDWIPTPDMRVENPDLPELVEGGTPENPLGPRALYLGNSMYRIHGTNNPNSIGRSASHGCYRMQNASILALYGMVGVGTKVVVTNSRSL